MPSTVLGKRTRSAIEVAAEARTSILTRSKRRVVLIGANDENQNPFVIHRDADGKGGSGMETEMEMDVDGPAKKTHRATATTRKTVPAKHGAAGRRVPVSPSPIKAHFRVGKAVAPTEAVCECEDDGKHDGQPTPPKTPRHRKPPSAKKVPVTPRHRLLFAGGSPATPRTPPKTPGGAASVYREVRQLFSRCSAPGRLVGRDGERGELSAFVDACLASAAAGCLYVSGPPGTGKSALVGEVLEQYRSGDDVRCCVINCMSVQNADDLGGKLSADLGLEPNAGVDELRSSFVRGGSAGDDRKYLVVLDEIDRLVDVDLALLYSLFEWSMHATSRLILIGIANALDLTDRFLPRLKSRNLKAELLPFMPYTAAQIAEVLTSKLQTYSPDPASPLPFLHPAAIQFCAKKVAAQTGDLRKAFDICRRAIDLVEQEVRDQAAAEKQNGNSPSKTPLMENINLSSPPTAHPVKSTSAPIYTPATAPRATIAHMARATAQAFSNGTTQRLATLNLQQKAALCALAALERHRRSTQQILPPTATPSKQTTSTAPTLKRLYTAYAQLCSPDYSSRHHHNHHLPTLTTTEFHDVVSGLETLGLLSLVAPGPGNVSRFASPLTPTRQKQISSFTINLGGGKGRRSKSGFPSTAAAAQEKCVVGVIGYEELWKAVVDGAGAGAGAGGELLRGVMEGEGLGFS